MSQELEYFPPTHELSIDSNQINIDEKINYEERNHIGFDIDSFHFYFYGLIKLDIWEQLKKEAELEFEYNFFLIGLKKNLVKIKKGDLISLNDLRDLFILFGDIILNEQLKLYKFSIPNPLPSIKLSTNPFLCVQILMIFVQVAISILIQITFKKAKTFTGQILYSFNQTVIGWLNNKKFPNTSVLSELKSDSTDKHTELCKRFPNSDLLVNLYLLGNIICQLWGILRIALIDLDAEDLIFKLQSVELSYCLLSYLPEEFVSYLYAMQERWRKQQLSELTIKFKTYLVSLEFFSDYFLAYLRLRLVG
jgi:hypothetical protein